MYRKKVFLLFVTLILMGLLPNFVSAQEDKSGLSGVADTIHNLFGFLPNIITLEKLVGEDAAALFWAKFLVWLLLFAVVYFGAGFAFKGNKRVATVVALVVSLMSALLMPNTVIINLFQTYGFVAGLLIWVIPVIAGFHLVTKIKPKLMKALIYLFMIFILMSIDKSITSNFGKNLVNNVWYSLFKLLLAVVIIAFLWNLLTAWTGGKGEESAGGWSGDRAKSFWDWINKPEERRRDGDFRSDFRHMPPGHGPAPPGPRPPGAAPPATPPRRHPTDPITPSGVPPPGLNPHAPGPRPTAPRIELEKRQKIPDEQILPLIDLSQYFNPIRNQDGLGACSAFAATSIFEYILHVGYGMRKYLSPLFLWYKTRETIGEVNKNDGPSTCAVPMMNLVRDGVCFEELWPFVGLPDPKWRTPPSEKAVLDAIQKKLIAFRSLDRDDPDQWVYALLEKNPINIAVNFPRDMAKPYYNNKKLYDNFGARSNIGVHAMVIVGYYSHYPYQGQGIKAFKIRNSHDIDWGENGYTWVPAEILKNMLFEDPIIIAGWNKEKYGKPEKTKTEIILEQIKAYAKEEKEWLDKEYKYLHSLKEHIDKGDYQSANEIMPMVKRSKNAAEAFEKRIESNLSKLMGRVQEPLKSLIAKIKRELSTQAKKLAKFTSKDEKSIQDGISYLKDESSKWDQEKYKRIKGDVQKIVGQALILLRALEGELDKLLNLEEEIYRKHNIK